MKRFDAVFLGICSAAILIDELGFAAWVVPLKGVPLTMLAVRAFNLPRGHGRLLLVSGLALGAAGDVLLAAAKHWLPTTLFAAGLTCFLFGHLAYIALHLPLRHATPQRLALAFVVLLCATEMVLFLWPFLHEAPVPAGLRYAVFAYVGALTAMVVASVLRRAPDWGLAAGALLFFASDSLISIKIFARVDVSHAVFWTLSTYYAAQWLIARAGPRDA